MSAPAHDEAPIPAASLILIRPSGGGLEVCLLQRSTASRFMPGSWVFPGGWIDASDRDAAFWGTHCDLTPEEIAQRLARGIDAAVALSAAVAAARETFEEAGVLFADPPAGAGRGAPSARTDFRRHFEEGASLLALSALAPWSHWITPVGMPRRFDTRFFAACLPAGEEVRPDGRETTAAIWTLPQRALEENMAGRLPLSPPTLATLHELLGFPTLERLQAETGGRGWVGPILPRLVPLGNARGAVIVEPWDPMYSNAEISIDPAVLEKRVLPVGEPFSRIWNLNGFCRPVAL